MFAGDVIITKVNGLFYAYVARDTWVSAQSIAELEHKIASGQWTTPQWTLTTESGQQLSTSNKALALRWANTQTWERLTISWKS